MKNLFLLYLFILICSHLNAQSTAGFDFNTPGQLTSEFNQGGSASNITQSTTSGIDGTGAINITNVSTNEVFVTKQGYTNGGVGSVYTFSTFFKSVWNSGYGGIGFTTDANATYQSFAYASNSIGISVHGGGYIFNSGTTTESGSWSSSINDLLNNGSPDDWYKVVFTVELKAGNVFDLTCEVFPANEDGSLIDPNSPPQAEATETTSFTNPSMASANIIYSYFGFGGRRISDFDNYEIDLEGSSIIEEGTPIVTGSASMNAGDIDLTGEVTDDRGSSVTDRGFVYSMSDSLPTVGTGTVMQAGTGMGTFNDQIVNPPNGTYFFRSYATNTSGTSYGESVEIQAAPLPVELTNFEVKAVEDNMVHLEWITAMELNNKHFEIERSVDGKQFETIEIIDGQGNSAQSISYSFMDKNVPTDKKIIYYKLKQLDFDGQFSYSSIKSVQFENDFDFIVSPNPAGDNLTLEFSDQQGEVLLEIVNLEGRNIHSETILLENKSENRFMDLSDFEAGVYIISVTSDTQNKSIQLIKR